MTHTVRRRLTRSSHVGDRRVPHSLSALLTPTRAPHARLLKHWEGQIVSLALVRHPHVHHTLVCTLPRLHASSLARFLSGSLLPSCASTLAFVSCLLRLPAFFFARLPSHFLLPQNGPPIRFISAARLGGRRVHPKLTLAPLAHGYHDDPCALKKGGRRRSRQNVAEEK